MSADQRMKEEHTVVLAALLRGVEECLRLGGDAGEEAEGLATQWKDRLTRCVDADLLSMLFHIGPQPSVASRDSDPREGALVELLSCAERLASPERASSDAATELPPSGLMPTFDRIELLKRHSPVIRRFRLAPLSDAHSKTEPPFFAEDGYEPTSSDFTTHISAFRRQLYVLAERLDWSRFDCVYTHLLNLLHTYAWCLPSERFAKSDVSLYDRVRTSAAIAACLYRYHAERGALTVEAIRETNQSRCILLSGGVSGIQDYIFDISTIGAGGVAKRLRARSFFVQLLSEAAALRVLHELEMLPLPNVLMASGGKFYILAPNQAETIARLESLQRDFDERLLSEFHGLLAVNLAWTDLSDAEFAPGAFSVALARLHYRLQGRKAQRLSMALQDDGGWRNEFVREPFAGARVCLSCRRFPAVKRSQDQPAEEGPDICEQCALQLDLGRKLTKAKFISFHHGEGGDVSCLGFKASLTDRPVPGALLAVRLNSPDVSHAMEAPVAFRYLANHVPVEANGTRWTFEDIAAQKKLGDEEKSSAMLGVLKADADYVGQVFQEGLRRDQDETGFDTLARVSGMSRQLELFFSAWLEWLLATKYRGCYAVYSGGDDLVLISPRVLAIDLARDIRNAFTRYTRNDEITISAGLALVKPRTPLAHTVTLAQESLDGAKAAGRNHFSVFKEAVEWGALESFDRIVRLLEKAAPASALLYQLLRSAMTYREFADPTKRSIRGLRCIPMLAEALARNVDIKKQAELFDWGSRLLDVRFQNGELVETDLNNLALPAQWVILGRRER